MQFAAYVSGIVTLLVLWILYRIFSGTWDVWKIVEGSDGRPSTSKLQWFLWTVVVIFAYIVVYAARVYYGDYQPITDIPANLLATMGISITSMVAAKGITVSQVSNGQVTKPQMASGTAGLGSLIQDDTGAPDLSKIQIMAWTLIAIVVYLVRLIHTVNNVPPPTAGNPFSLELPDIDQALMVLMGLGHGAYLGKKLVTTSTPRLSGLSPGMGPAGTSVVLSGAGFGDTQGGSLLTVDGQPIFPGGVTWGDTQISFQIPPQQHNGSPWNPGQRILIGVIVNGQEGANTLPFTVNGNGQGTNFPQTAVAPPIPANPTPPPAPPPTPPPPAAAQPVANDPTSTGDIPPVDTMAPAADTPTAADTAPPTDPDATSVNPQVTD